MKVTILASSEYDQTWLWVIIIIRSYAYNFECNVYVQWNMNRKYVEILTTKLKNKSAKLSWYHNNISCLLPNCASSRSHSISKFRPSYDMICVYRCYYTMYTLSIWLDKRYYQSYQSTNDITFIHIEKSQMHNFTWELQ